MTRKLLGVIALLSMGIVTVSFAYPNADEESPRKKAVAELAAKFEYPGHRAKQYNAGEIYQSITTTPDDLKTVSLWYHQQLHIRESTLEGAEYTKRPDLKMDRATTTFRDGMRPKEPDQEKVDIRPDTTCSFVYRVPEVTVVVVINRAAGDKKTAISLSLIPGKMAVEK